MQQAQEIAEVVLKRLGIQQKIVKEAKEEAKQPTIDLDEEFRLQTKIEATIRELERLKDDKITHISTYYGDIVVNGKECEGTKVLIGFSKEIEGDLLYDEYSCEIPEPTSQDIIEAYYITKHNIEALILKSVGLDHITNKYLEVLELEKEECRKALTEDNKEYFKLL